MTARLRKRKKIHQEENINRLAHVVGILKPTTRAIVRLFQSANPDIETAVETVIAGVRKDSLLHMQSAALRQETIAVFLQGIAHSVGYVMSHDDRSVMMRTIQQHERGDLYDTITQGHSESQ